MVLKQAALPLCSPGQFENDVKMYGTQTRKRKDGE